MRRIILISAFCCQMVWCYGFPGANQVGAFAYQDSSGNRYGGTYGLKDGKVVETEGTFPPNFEVNGFRDWDYFTPEYFRNLENLLQEDNCGRFARSTRLPRFTPFEPFKPFKSFKPFKPLKQFKPMKSIRAFNTNLEHQQLALNAARKAFDLTSNQAGFIPNFHYRFPGFYDFPDFVGFPGPSASRMPQMNGNDYNAYASASAVPGMNHQVAAINPANPAMPNVDKINRYQDSRTPGGGYTSVSSSSYSTSSNDNGQVKNSRGAETIVNNNGRVTRYKVQS